MKYICRDPNEATKTYNYLSDPEYINGLILSRTGGWGWGWEEWAGRGKAAVVFPGAIPKC